MTNETLWLAATASAIGVGHTLLGPDHYIPFVALARAREWSRRKTLAVTVACGLGHVLGSLLLGLLAVGLGWTLGRVESLESMRGGIAGWLLLGFGVAYTAWGLRQAFRSREHEHFHVHEDGRGHRHTHDHHHDHAHVHEGSARAITPWILFTIFVFGPCEPLIPLMMAPAVSGSVLDVALVLAAFAAATLGTMALAVQLLFSASQRTRLGSLARFQHALAGGALVACGAAIQLGL